ncbi:hypothetical protein BK011_05730 [Tenericutes bacterium MZ-XQ]|nr:hypothetical protein BK011_05730 [Tenericutes bacterium MZ-XQ]
MKLSIRVLLHTLGFIIIALGISSILNSNLGASPIDAFNYFLQKIVVEFIPWATIGRVIIFTGLVVTLLTFLLNLEYDMLISAIFLFVVGIFVDGWNALFALIPIEITSLLAIKILMASLGMMLCAFGVAITILTGLPASPYERLMLVIYKKIKVLSLSKIIVEGSFFIIAVILGLMTKSLFEQVHVFTVIMTFMMGILVGMFTHILKKINQKGELKYEA